MRIAVFGGSFDPPHIGHTEIVKEALKELDVDKLFVIPTFLNPFKKSFKTAPKIRLKWLEIIFENEKKVEVLNYEIEQNRAVPSIETIKYIEDKYHPKKLYFIIGADNLNSLTSWNSFEELNNKVEFVVAYRDDIKIDSSFKRLLVKMSISSSSLRNN